MLFDELCEDDISLEGSSDWPTSHDGELFFGRVTSGEYLCVPWIDSRPISDAIGILVLVVVDDDLISVHKSVDECKYIIVFTLDPWIVRRVTKYERIANFTRMGGSWISHDSFFELFHEYILHLTELRMSVMFDIDEWYIFAKTRDDESILIGSH